MLKTGRDGTAPRVYLHLLNRKPFKADFPHLLQRLQAAVAKNDAALVASVSHTLKGMLANLAAEKASAAAARLEKTARSGEVAALPAVFFDFEELVTGLLPEIEAYMAEAHS